MRRRSPRPLGLRRAVGLLVALGLGTFGLAAGAGAEPRAAELSVLSYNTHGLPGWVAGDAPRRRFPRIGALIQRYDVALIQEDFAHHELLRGAAARLALGRGNASRFRGTPVCLLFCDGSGLSFATRLPRDARLALESRPYESCAGWILGASDCFATKGFQHARLRLADSFVVHVVNTHLDAGRRAEDRAVRALQLRKLRDYLEREAAGAALVLGGDLNLDAGDPADAALRDEFAAALGLEDARALPSDDTWKRLDYLYFRSGSAVRLERIEAGEDTRFVDAAGGALSDHPAIFARLRAEGRF